jgi:hypothetical protein
MANTAFEQANLAYNQANTATVLAQAAYNQANTFLPASGSNSWVQFNDGGVLGSNSELTFNKSTGTLSVKNVTIGDDLRVTNNIITEGDIIPTELGQNIGDPNSRWYNLYMDGGLYASGTFGNPGQILSSDGYGTLKWVDPPNANVDGNLVVYAIDETARGLANSATVLAQAAFNKANTGTGGTTSAVDQYARNTANTARNDIVVIKSVNLTQNTSIINTNILAQAAFDRANSISVTSIDQFARNTANNSFDRANLSINFGQSAYNQANAATNNAASASLYANSGITLAQAAYNFANTISGGSAQDGWARDQANSAFAQANLAFNSAALASLYGISGINLAQSAYNQGNSTAIIANTAVNNAASSSLYANNGITLAQAAFDAANNVTPQIQPAFDTANAAYNQANTATNDSASASLYANTGINDAASASLYANTGITLAQSVYNYANTLAGGSSIDNTARILAQAAYDQGNSAIDLAQSAFDYSNNIIVIGNTIPLGTNTQGLLVSNAVTLTTSTNVTNGLALLNQVLGKLVPASPPVFPNGNNLNINSTVGPYRMTNFTQIDNTVTGGKSVSGGTSRSVRRADTYSTNVLNDMGPGDNGTLSIIKNSSNAGGLTLTNSSANGTYGDLIVSDSVDFSAKSGAAAGFWRSFDSQASGTVSSGWNEIYISHSGAGNTSTTSWYYDASAPGTPTFSSVSIVPLSTSLTYSSTIPHYNSSTTFKLGVDVSKLSGDMYPSSDTFFTGSPGGAFQTPASNTYSGVGITTPLDRNLYVSSGSVTVNTTASITSSSFGSSSTGPSVTVNNSYNTGTQVFTSALSNTVLYKTGTSSSMEETSVTIGSTIGVGSGLAARIINPGTTDTPTYTASASLFNSQTSTLTVNDATIVAATLKHDQTNYSTGYLPAGPNLSSGRSGSQYFTFKFVRTSVSKFDIQFTGTIAGLWVALPGSTIDTTSTLNGWIDMSTAYAGSGIPGASIAAGGNGSNGCALGGIVTLNSAVTNHRKTCTFGTVSSSSTPSNEIYVRIKLTSGQSVSALSLQTASN